MTHQTPKPPSDKPAPLRENTPNGSSQRQRQSPTEAYVHGPGQKQRPHTNIPDPRDLERDPPGTMHFPGPNPDEPAKQLSGGQSIPDHDDETPDPGLSGDPDQPRTHDVPSVPRP